VDVGAAAFIVIQKEIQIKSRFRVTMRNKWGLTRRRGVAEGKHPAIHPSPKVRIL
jgi:hypothetical protein